MQTLINSEKKNKKIIKLEIQLWDIFMCLTFDTATSVDADIISLLSMLMCDASMFMCDASVPVINRLHRL